MKFFNRKVDTDTRQELSAHTYQAAYNSDGCITLRGIVKGNSDLSSEIILVLNPLETKAIIDLMKKLNLFVDDMPF